MRSRAQSSASLNATDADLKALTAELHKLNSHRFIRIHNSTRRLVFFQFLRGLAFGLGSVVGATALVSVLVLVLSQIEFIPILGDLATEIIEEIQVDQNQ
ncbi:hypothetical protein J1C49_04835 [Cognatishimia sp. F0-27]|nr:hypothetical protein [Cognatishimia sp. F0-27]